MIALRCDGFFVLAFENDLGDNIHHFPRFFLLFTIILPSTFIFSFAHSTNAGFRISLTGTALEQRATPQVVKKLKLVGTPTKIYKNSAFITGTLLLLLFLIYFWSAMRSPLIRLDPHFCT